MPWQAAVSTVAGATYGAYKSRALIKVRPTSFALNTLRLSTLAYVFGFCMLKDSVPFYQHVYSLELTKKAKLVDAKDPISEKKEHLVS